MDQRFEHPSSENMKSPRQMVENLDGQTFPKKLEELSTLEIIDAVEKEIEQHRISSIFPDNITYNYDRQSLLEKAIHNARVTAADSTFRDNVLLSYSGQERRAIATVCCFLLVKGKSKAGKTNFVLWVVAVLLGLKGFPYDGGLAAFDEILWVDTEQSRLHVALIGSTMAKLFGLESFHPRLTLVSLRPYSHHARWHLIEYMVKSNDRIKILVIDNLADLLGSILDDREATELFGRIIRLIEAKKISVLAVLHTNKSNSHSRGFAGSLAEQFAECVWEITRANGVVHANAVLTRNAPFPLVTYRYNDGTFEFIDEVKTTAVKIAKKDFEKVPIDVHNQVLAEIFKNQPELLPHEFQTKLREVYARLVTSIGLELVSRLQGFYVRQNMIVKEGKKLKMA